MAEAKRNEEFEELLQFLKTSRGFDVTGYKRSTLERRVTNRMRVFEIKEYGAYQGFLENHPEEFPRLFDTILINVTAFFRDPQAWAVLARNQIPQLIERRKPDQPIRVWSAGCSSGEEAYTIAMLLAEALGPNELVHGAKIYATDIDEEALARARRGNYAAKDLEPVPRDLAARYFEPAGASLSFRSDLRRSLIFRHHDLLAQAPISRIDLLVCRNTLMYMNTETQQEALRRFHFALNETGLLFLGRAETLMGSSDLFTPVEFQHRIFAKLKPPLDSPAVSTRFAQPVD